MHKKTTGNFSNRCDEVIRPYNLLEHPFYRAWSAGTLPVEALTEYASEYGMFIKLISKGWKAIGKNDIAKHEVAHSKIWDASFAAALNTTVDRAQIKEAANLVETADDLFNERSTALGAIYAFESQQPLTAQSKLKGLQEHYRQLPESCGDYFRLHTDDYDEVSILVEMLEELEEGEQQRALPACEKLSRALYDALTGIYAAAD